MRAVIRIDESREAAPAIDGAELAVLIAQVRMAVMVGVDAELRRDETLAELEVTTAQFAILRILLQGAAESACELCKKLDYDRGAMSRMIDRLEQKGLIRRVPLAHTRRTVALEVTAAGKVALPLMEACLERVMQRLLKGVSPGQVGEMGKVLKRMLSNE
jgi:DNA-binding MarR family transcriptional regulator